VKYKKDNVYNIYILDYYNYDIFLNLIDLNNLTFSFQMYNTIVMSNLFWFSYWCYWQAIYEVIANDPDIEKIQKLITVGMANNGTSLTSYLGTYDNYKEIWEINKDAFIRRYQKLNPQVSSFDADIARLTRDYRFKIWLKLTVIISKSRYKHKNNNFNWN